MIETLKGQVKNKIYNKFISSQLLNIIFSLTAESWDQNVFQ